MRKSFLSTKVAKFIGARKELFHTPVKCKDMIEKIDIKDASIAEMVRKNMSVATVNDKGLMNPSSVISDKRWYNNTPTGNSLKSLRIETDISKLEYDSFYIYLNIGQCYNKLFNEIIHVNIGRIEHKFTRHSVLKMSESSILKNLIASFDASSKLNINVNFVRGINNFAGATEIVIRNRTVPSVLNPQFNVEEYIPKVDDYVISFE